MKTYFIGIGGIGMSGVAGLAKEKGYEVLGSEASEIYPPSSEILNLLGIRVNKPAKENIYHFKPDLVVVGNAINSSHPEVLASQELGLSLLSFPEFINKYLLPGKKSLVVAGTHGKTTTSTLLAWCLSSLKEHPSFLIGGMGINFERNFAYAKGPWFVLEGDEYPSAFFDRRPKFLHYHPYGLILTSLEYDHADVYPDLKALEEVFRELIGDLEEGGVLVYHGEARNLRKVIEGLKGNFRLLSYGRQIGDYRLLDYESFFTGKHFLSRVTVRDNQGQIFTFTHRLLGLHNSLNILAVIALLEALGFPREGILKGIESFKGVKRRQEILLSEENLILIDDFAHHPTAVEITLRELIKSYKPSQVILFFEPRTNSSKRKVFQEAYIKALSLADTIFLKIPPKLEHIPKEERIDLNYIVEELKKRGKKVSILQEDIKPLNRNILTQKTLVVFMSSAYMKKEIEEIFTFLGKKSP